MSSAVIVLKGFAAIEYARREGLTLNRYGDPDEPLRDGLSVREASVIAGENPSLVWVNAHLARIPPEIGRDIPIRYFDKFRNR